MEQLVDFGVERLRVAVGRALNENRHHPGGERRCASPTESFR